MKLSPLYYDVSEETKIGLLEQPDVKLKKLTEKAIRAHNESIDNKISLLKNDQNYFTLDQEIRLAEQKIYEIPEDWEAFYQENSENDSYSHDINKKEPLTSKWQEWVLKLVSKWQKWIRKSSNENLENNKVVSEHIPDPDLSKSIISKVQKKDFMDLEILEDILELKRYLKECEYASSKKKTPDSINESEDMSISTTNSESTAPAADSINKLEDMSTATINSESTAPAVDSTVNFFYNIYMSMIHHPYMSLAFLSGSIAFVSINTTKITIFLKYFFSRN